MRGDRDRFADYPMVEEDEATGRVAGVYAQLLDGMPFVPSLFKSLALCPGYLVLAAEQAAPALRDDRFGALAQELAASVRTASIPPEDDEVRSVLARFAGPLSRMLLLAAGLRLALDDELDAPPAPGQVPASRPVQPRRPAPSPQDAPAAQVYGEIRAALDTPMVNSIWRELAGQGRLAAAWAALGPQAPATRPMAEDLQRRAVDAARRVPWQVAASPAALSQAGVADAAPGMAAVLEAYATTLPRVLVLAASSASGD
ncbi:hypothetical protein SAMN05661080_02114 [Modestobacter sp. DSM 44400]|uniref:hypothetical protein n=1 Tax=Modestobacter sp. DSM 44400 TaxID=1550230 RepID=UPI00089BA319|nr:hypothetical protein [Modestobacter sp. DSM 44400]SDY04499.1 hypothetical protein SAMN05661080_02114 [Modestobacter sp. DSM 44400]